MKKTVLEHNWQMKIIGENVYGIPEAWTDAQVPGSVYGNLLQKGLMQDPYYRMNELDALKLMENDFCFRTSFVLTEEQLEADCLMLRFDGVDTLSDIYLNDICIGHTDNMHRIWEFDVLEEEAGGERASCAAVFPDRIYCRGKRESLYRRRFRVHERVSPSAEGTLHVWLGLGAEAARCRNFPGSIFAGRRESPAGTGLHNAGLEKR